MEVLQDAATQTSNSITLCIIQAKFITLFSYPLQLLPVILTINLWFAVVRYDVKIEQKYFWWFTGFIWGWTILYNVISLILDSRVTNSNVSATEFFCVQSFKMMWIWYCYLISMIILTTISLIITVHSGIVFWSRWQNFSNRQSRNTAIKLGLAGRLLVLSSVFLPCCYYVPPNVLRSQEQSGISRDEVNPSFQLQIIGEDGNQLQLPSRSPRSHLGTNDIADMNILIPDSPGGGSSFLTISSQNMTLEDLPPLPSSPPPLPSPTIPLQTRDDFRIHELQRDGYSNSGQFNIDWYKIDDFEDNKDVVITD
ncbi:16081_t:CDS:2 [Dentiscutata heterogama]|uniref:16081_t:CDS:1 n=1 Tax=Dentiscutata heterogama TaxID=1316150 RepID=A0ACA9LC75_9GLOM|nr:16081_t:CDS:2 [Dentiscutata heterogama]